MKKLFTYFAILLISGSCIDSIPLDSLPVNNILVLNCLITPDSLFSCTVSRVYPVNDTSDHFIRNAKVIISDEESGNVVCQLIHIRDGIYKANGSKPIEGKKYRIEVSAYGYQTINGITNIPYQQQAKDVYVVRKGGFDPTADQDYAELRFTISDEFNGSNYYETSLSSLIKWGEDYEYDPGQGMFKKIDLEDSIYIITDAKDYSWYTIVDAVIQAGGLMRYNPSSLVFTDNLFNLSSHSFVVRCSFNTDKYNYFILYSISPELYQFQTTLMQHQYEMGAKGISRFDDLAGLDFSSKAIDVYSNMMGGYGIFAGYNTHILYSKIVVPEYTYDPDGNLIEAIYPETVNIDQTINPYEH